MGHRYTYTDEFKREAVEYVEDVGSADDLVPANC